MQKRRIQAGLLVACLVCAVLSVLPGKAWLVREGILVTGAALWLIKTELRQPKFSGASIMQILMMLALGALLWKAGGVYHVPEYIWGAQSARIVLGHILMLTVGILVVPACFCFYLCTPRRTCLRRIPQARRVPRMALTDYRAAV